MIVMVPGVIQRSKGLVRGVFLCGRTVRCCVMLFLVYSFVVVTLQVRGGCSSMGFESWKLAGVLITIAVSDFHDFPRLIFL